MRMEQACQLRHSHSMLHQQRLMERSQGSSRSKSTCSGIGKRPTPDENLLFSTGPLSYDALKVNTNRVVINNQGYNQLPKKARLYPQATNWIWSVKNEQGHIGAGARHHHVPQTPDDFACYLFVYLLILLFLLILFHYALRMSLCYFSL